jgi:hypothetical protein
VITGVDGKNDLPEMGCEVGNFSSTSGTAYGWGYSETCAFFAVSIFIKHIDR